MPLKTVELEGKVYAEVQDGRPVYVDDAGKEHLYDAEAMRGSLTRLETDLGNTKSNYAKLQEQIKAFDGLDPSKSREAIEKLSLIDANKLVAAGDMDAAIAAAVKPMKEELAAKDNTIQGLQGSLSAEKIGNQFSQSKFVSEKLTPAGADLIKTLYGGNLKIEDNRIVGLDPNGQPIRSAANPAEMAGFDEVIETFVNAYPHKDHILKGNQSQGGGAKPNSNNGSNGAKTITRDQYDAMEPMARASKMREGFKVTDAN